MLVTSDSEKVIPIIARAIETNCNTQIFSLVCSGINLFSFFFPGKIQFSRFVIRLYFLFHTNFKITIYDHLDKIIWSQLSNDDAIVYTLTLEGI